MPIELVDLAPRAGVVESGQSPATLVVGTAPRMGVTIVVHTKPGGGGGANLANGFSPQLLIVNCCLLIAARWSLGVNRWASLCQRSQPATIHGVVPLSSSLLGFLSIGCVKML